MAFKSYYITEENKPTHPTLYLQKLEKKESFILGDRRVTPYYEIVSLFFIGNIVMLIDNDNDSIMIDNRYIGRIYVKERTGYFGYKIIPVEPNERGYIRTTLIHNDSSKTKYQLTWEPMNDQAHNYIFSENFLKQMYEHLIFKSDI